MEQEKEKKELTILGLSIWKIYAYFVVYSIIGYIIETIFALLVYGVIESRKSFLYGPFCSIYGVGAVLMIIALRYFNKNGYTLFISGFVIGSIIEYLISFIGEVLFQVKWWDYSNNFLNINGRICLTYSLFWGVLAIYLMRGINPKIDKSIDYLKKKINQKSLRSIALVMTIVLIIDCLISGFAVDKYKTREIVENDLDVKNKEIIIQKYEKTNRNEFESKIINKFFNNEKMVKTYPNLTITLKDGTVKRIREYLPEIKPYYYKFK